MAIRILLADDHKMLREGLRLLIAEEPDMKIIAEAEDGKSAVELASELKPDIILMDITMPGLNGIEATRKIMAASGDSKIIALSMHIQRRMVREMINAGASGYVSKDCGHEEIIRAVRSVAAGGAYFCPNISKTVLVEHAHGEAAAGSPGIDRLTGREGEVLRLLTEGKTTKDIAAMLHISPKTAEFHRQQIMQRLNINNLAELTKLAIREGLTPL